LTQPGRERRYGNCFRICAKVESHEIEGPTDADAGPNRIVGYDNERLAFRFTMLNGDETINCQISDAALDELVGTIASLYTVRQAQFLTHRETIEKLASDLFDATGAIPGSVVRIFS
jgi:hypothetical protein